MDSAPPGTTQNGCTMASVHGKKNGVKVNKLRNQKSFARKYKAPREDCQHPPPPKEVARKCNDFSWATLWAARAECFKTQHLCNIEHSFCNSRVGGLRMNEAPNSVF